MLYKLAKSILFQMQPETAHHVIMANLDWITTLGLHKLLTHTPPEDPVEVMGIRFPNTIGLAAGMDKDGERVSAFGALGFGHVEIGTITPVGQPGNPKPRCFRVIPAEGIVNRMGFNNVGCEQVMRNLKSADAFHLRGGVLGINIGKNAVTPIENAVSDFRISLTKSYDRADYIAVNISSPNTKNLRSLQAEAPLRELLGALRDERNRIIDSEGAPYKPIAVKLAPDLENDAILRAVDIIVESDMDAVIATNTTIDHTSVQGLPHWNETGGPVGPSAHGPLDRVPLDDHRTPQGQASRDRLGRRDVGRGCRRQDAGGRQPRAAVLGLCVQGTGPRDRMRGSHRQVAQGTRRPVR